MIIVMINDYCNEKFDLVNDTCVYKNEHLLNCFVFKGNRT